MIDRLGERSTDSYCRDVERYLCQKNDGHLIRIVGPAFEQVCGWAQRGVPLSVVYRGIDRCVERYYAKGPRRRPVRIDFCEADVLDVFDEWRRAVGVQAAGALVAGPDLPAPDQERQGRAAALHTHIDRVVSRLVALRSGAAADLDATIADTVRELDVLRARAKGARGEARAGLLDRLSRLDAELLHAAEQATPEAVRDSLVREAQAELEPFRIRMPAGAFDRSLRAATERLLREKLGLPRLTPEG